MNPAGRPTLTATSSTVVYWPSPPPTTYVATTHGWPDEPDISQDGGVREPRTPRPPSPAGSAALPVPVQAERLWVAA